MYTTANDAEGPYFVFVHKSLFVRNVSYGAGNGIVSFLNSDLRIPVVSRRGEFVRDAVGNERDPFILALLVLIALLLCETLTFSTLLSARNGTVSPLSISLYRFVQNVRHFHFNKLFSRNDPPHAASNESRQSGRKKLFTLGTLVVIMLLGFQFITLALSHRLNRQVLNSEHTFELFQPINPDWHTVWNASSRLLNQPCVAVTITNARSLRTRINNCVTSTLSANQFEPYEPVRLDTVLNASIVTNLHAYGADHVLTIDGESVEFVARSYFSLDDMQERVMKQRAKFNRIDRQMAVVHQQFFAYLFSSYVRTTRDESLSLEQLRELMVEPLSSSEGSVLGISQVDGGAEVFQTSSIRYETKFRGVMPRGVAALRFGQAFFKGMIGVEVNSGDVTDLIAGVGLIEAESLVWSERRRRLNWLALLVMNGTLVMAVVIVRKWLKPANELDVATGGLKGVGGCESAILMEATEDDGEREFQQRKRQLSSLGAGMDGSFYLKKSEEYPATCDGGYKI
eukprot:GFKZ01009589.1.p1 GENE.GFKZ01009589.1~~GFKZ01009589.1.p1  ORF type:complete len:512 (+),score=61.75 GFKZ01009589.1:417-1952(+)